MISADLEVSWRLARLTRPSQFQAVLRAGRRRESRFFRLQSLVVSETRASARLGITVAKRVDKLAVGRNRIKRQIRASFQAVRGQLPARDYVVVAKREAARASRADLAADLVQLWRAVSERQLPLAPAEVTMPD